MTGKIPSNTHKEPQITTALMEARIKALLEDVSKTQTDCILGMLQFRLVECDAAAGTLLLAFPGAAWQRNPMGVMHGGLVATVLDCVGGFLAVCYYGEKPVTVSLQVSYLRTTPVDGTLMVRARATKVGRSLFHVFAECWAEDAPGKPTATANGVYMPPRRDTAL